MLDLPEKYTTDGLMALATVSLWGKEVRSMPWHYMTFSTLPRTEYFLRRGYSEFIFLSEDLNT